MGFSDETLDRIFLPRFVEKHGWDTASEYGEPGYGNSGTRLVVMGDFWCRCGNNPRAGQRRYGDKLIEPGDLHVYDEHHPGAWQAWLDSGVEIEWHDEWMVDYDHDKAYRTKGDSYSWQPQVLHDWEYDYWLTPDTPIEDWVRWAANDPERCLLSNLHDASDLEDIGFVEYASERDGAWGGGPFETGWHPGQTDDPKVVLDKIIEQHPDAEVVFCITENSQFYTRWAAFYRLNQEE
jgi:hypothetical protein